MRRLGWLLTAVGGVLILSPLAVAIANLGLGLGGPSIVLERAPTVVIGGLFSFVAGIALRELG